VGKPKIKLKSENSGLRINLCVIYAIQNKVPRNGTNREFIAL
jgi:hypothetical protein